VADSCFSPVEAGEVGGETADEHDAVDAASPDALGVVIAATSPVESDEV
jgi:hypothetical protein